MKTLLVASCAAVTIAALIWVAFLAPRFRAAAQALLEGRVLLDRRDYPEAARGVDARRGLDRGPSRRRTAVAGIGRGTPIDGPRGGGRPPAPPRRSPAIRRIGRQPSRPVGKGSRAALPRPLGIARARCSSGRNAARPSSSSSGSGTTCSNWRSSGRTFACAWRQTRRRPSEAHRAGLGLLDEAEALFGPSHVLYRARQAHAAALGLSSMAEAAARGASRVPPRTAWEHDAAGRVLLAAGDLAQAEAAFEQALALRAPGLMAEFPSGRVRFPPRPLPGCRERLSRLHRAGPRSCRVLLQPRPGPRRPGP